MIQARNNSTRTVLFGLLAAVAVLLISTTGALAATYTLTSNNSQVTIDPATTLGMDSWQIDSIDELASQWWFYSINGSPEQSINNLGPCTAVQYAPNVVQLTFKGTLVDFTVTYTLVGGPIGSRSSTIAESVRIRNKSAGFVNFTLFEFDDLDMNNTADDDTAVCTNPASILQWDGGLLTTESAAVGGVTPIPDAFEIADAAALYGKLTDAVFDGLSGGPQQFGPANAAFAFQWNYAIAAGATKLLSKSKIVQPSGSLGDYVWFDANADGIQDATEAGIPGVRLVLEADLDFDGIVDYTSDTTTDASGKYLFPNLPAGNYRVSVDTSTLPAEFIQTYDLDGLSTPNAAGVTLASGESNLNVDFGYTKVSDHLASFTQGGWGSKPHGNNPGALLLANFSRVYPAGYVMIGGTNHLKFTSANAISAFLPQGGTPDCLSRSYTNPRGKTEAGVLAGQVLALKLNVDFSQAGITPFGLGSVKLTSGKLAGSTVSQILALAEQVLGGDLGALPNGITISDLNDICTGINEMYN